MRARERVNLILCLLKVRELKGPYQHCPCVAFSFITIQFYYLISKCMLNGN